MRNLKRALSLALASVMLMGMMVVGTGAAFADESKIENAEAATVLSALEIMVGDGTNFNPTQIVTRAEMAMLLCKMMQVDENLLASNADTVVFTDVPAGQWYTGAIACAAEMGWIVGDGAGAFNPTNTVTTAQAALMIQKALGYWNVNDPATVDADGKLVDITGKANTMAYGLNMMTDLTVAANAGLTRDNVAGMLYNTIKNNVFVIYNDTNKAYVLADALTTLATAGNVASAAEDGSIFKSFGLTANETYTDALGRPVTAWVDADGEVVTSTVTDADLVYTAATDAEDIADDLDGRTVKSVSGTTKTVAQIVELLGGGKVVEIFFADDAAAKMVSYKYATSAVKSVKAVTEDDVTTTTVTLDDNKTYVTTAGTDLAEDDIVVYTAINANSKNPADGKVYVGGIATIAVAETVSGTVTATGDGYIRLDGVKYDVTGPAVKDEGYVILDPNGNAIKFVADDGSTASDVNYAYVTRYVIVTDAATGEDTGYADITLADGSEITVSVDTEDTNIAAIAKVDGTPTVATYTVKDGVYTLKTITAGEIESSAVKTDGSFTKDDAAITNGSRKFGDFAVDFDTIFVDVEAGVAYTGIEAVPTYNATGLKSFVVTDEKVASIVFITAGTTADADADAEYIYILDFKYEESVDADDNTIYTYTGIYTDGVQTDLVASKKLTQTEAGLYTVKTVDADGYVTAVAVKAASVEDVTVTSITDKAIYDNADTYYTYDSKTVFIAVEDGEVTAASKSDIILEADQDDKTCTIDVVVDGSYAEYVIITIAEKA